MMFQILVIDDSKSVHAFVQDCLKDYLVKITRAYDGAQGVAHLSAAHPKPNLILLDWEMPNLDGPGFLAQIKGDLAPFATPLPVFMMTSRNSPEEIGEMLKLGAKDYLMKPFTRDILLGKISDYFPDFGKVHAA